jgi:hypothetical protein
MASMAIRGRWFGWGNYGGLPTQVAPASLNGLVANLQFGEQLRAGPATAQFTATVATVARTVTGVAVSGRNLLVTLAGPTPGAGAGIVITYVPGGTANLRLADIFNDEAAGFTTAFAAPAV